MGNCVSSKYVHVGHDYNCDLEGGSTGSSIGNESCKSAGWVFKLSKKEAYAKYLRDGSLLTDELLNLRASMDNQDFFKGLCYHAKDKNKVELLLSWTEIVQFKSIDSEALEFLTRQIELFYTKYFVDDGARGLFKSDAYCDKAEELLKWGKSTLRESIDNIAKTSQTHPHMLEHMLDHMQRVCLTEINSQLYQSYMKTESYKAFVNNIANSNQVFADDFEYFELLGSGNFGLVMHARKKSTNIEYAMKIQSKSALLKNFQDVPEKIVYEREAAALLQHPFICSMEYSFQTNNLVMMAMELETGGTLFDDLKLCPKFRMPEERVVFYTAEIVSALSHIHRMGLIYRDLKPENVLLCSDGHIKLTDLGCVTDVKGDYLGKQRRPSNVNGNSKANIFASDDGPTPPLVESFPFGAMFSKVASKVNSEVMSHASSFSSNVSKSDRSGKSVHSGKSTPAPAPYLNRALSIIGTGGYMAPEMLLLLSEFYPESSGYSYSVDYWSLGITIYRLLTGKIPFTDSQVSTFLPYIRNNNKSVRENPPTDDTNFLICNSESKDENSDSSSRHSRNLPLVYATFLSKLQLIHAFASQSSIQIITKLLEIDEKKRLGSSLSELKAEPFFHGIDWGLLIQKKVSPPVLPLPVVTSLNAEDLQALNEGVGSVKAKDGYFSFSASTLAAGANSGSQVRIGKSFTQVMEEMMDPPENSKFNKHSVIVTKNDDIGETEQGYFDSWNYIAPRVLKMEIAIAIDNAEAEAHMRELSISQSHASDGKSLGGIVRLLRGKSASIIPREVYAGAVQSPNYSYSADASSGVRSSITPMDGTSSTVPPNDELLDAKTMSMDPIKQMAFLENVTQASMPIQ